MRVEIFVLIYTFLIGRTVLCKLEFKYHDNDELEQILLNFTVPEPLRARVYTIGKTLDDRKLRVIEITASQRGALKVPNVKLIGNIHGNEVVGREVLLHFLYYLRDEYMQGNKSIELLLNTTKIHILPTLNPDGFNRSKMTCLDDEGRHNGKGHVDLNRSFPDLYHRNPIPPQPETKAVMKWMEEIPFILSASLHGGALVANYPYDTLRERSSNYHLEKPSSLTPDDDVFKHLSKTYSFNHSKMHLGTYCTTSRTKFKDGITNGALWYSFEGGMQDYNYFKHGCMELTLEISCCKYPKKFTLETYWKDNREALVALCKEAQRGVFGQVMDRETLQPISGAQLQILGRNISFSSFNRTGEYWRILLPGNYTIQVQAKGYYGKSLSFEISPKRPRLELDLFLLNSTTSTTPPTSLSTIAVEQSQTTPDNFTKDDLSPVMYDHVSSERSLRNVQLVSEHNSSKRCLSNLAVVLLAHLLIFI